MPQGSAFEDGVVGAHPSALSRLDPLAVRLQAADIGALAGIHGSLCEPYSRQVTNSGAQKDHPRIKALEQFPI